MDGRNRTIWKVPVNASEGHWSAWLARVRTPGQYVRETPAMDTGIERVHSHGPVRDLTGEGVYASDETRTY